MKSADNSFDKNRIAAITKGDPIWVRTTRAKRPGAATPVLELIGVTTVSAPTTRAVI